MMRRLIGRAGHREPGSLRAEPKRGDALRERRSSASHLAITVICTYHIPVSGHLGRSRRAASVSNDRVANTADHLESRL